VRSQFESGIKEFIELLLPMLPAGSSKVQRREAIAACAAMVGAMVLARAVNDDAFSEEILQAVRTHINELEKARST
jgi:TetR/AcrR family transcriptional repressor of nem operon